MALPKLSVSRKISLTLSAVLFGSTLTAHAGGMSDGGGKGLLCSEAEGKTRVYLADTFDLVHGSNVALIKPIDPKAVVEAAAELIDQMLPAKSYDHPFIHGRKVTFGWMVRYKAAGLSSEYAGQLEDLPDDHINLENYPENCRTKVQLARQDLKSGKIRVDHVKVGEMTWLERGFLDLHETLIALRNEPGADTTPIRADVNAVAELMHDRNSPFYRMILSTVAPADLPPSRPEASWASNYINAHCYGSEYYESELVRAFCKKAEADHKSEWNRADKNSALQTLVRAPRSMECKIMSAGHQSFPIEARGFSLTRIKGDGRPKSNNIFALRMNKSLPTFSSHANLITHRHDRLSGFRSVGELSFSVSFPAKAGMESQVFLRDFSPATGTFSGHLTIQPKDGKLDDGFNSWGVVCQPSDADFALDLEQSY